MSRRSTLVSLAIGFAACSPGAETPPPAELPPPGPDYAMLMEAGRIPGLAVAVLEDGESRVELFGVTSAESGEALTDEMLFEAASLSKPVFATAVLRLAERGEFDLDQPLLELLPYERVSHDPRSAGLTGRIVLSHRTGLPNWGPEKLEFAAAPGDGFGYSGEGYVYLQRAIQEQTGLSLDELVRREVFDPLGMSRSRFSWPEGAEVALVTPHDEGGAVQPKRPEHEGNAAGSLHTTAAEYARFVTAWLDGELLSQESVAEALTPVSHMHGGERGIEDPLVWSRIGWGLGWGVQLPEEGSTGRPIYWHWGDNGPFKAFVAFDAETRQGVAYFANSMNGLAIGDAIVAAHVGDLSRVFEWLEVVGYDSPGYAERIEGVVAETEGRYAEAAAVFRLASVADPENEELARRVEWLTELSNVLQRPLTVPSSTLRSYVGSYGPRQLTLEDGALYYQRGEGNRYRLLPLSETLFALDGMTIFRLEVVTDGSGSPLKLVGHYVDGATDESPRGPAEGS